MPSPTLTAPVKVLVPVSTLRPVPAAVNWVALAPLLAITEPIVRVPVE